MVGLLFSFLPCGGVVGIWQFFIACLLCSPMFLYCGSLEGYMMGGWFGVDEWSGSLAFLGAWLGALMIWSLIPSFSFCVWWVAVSSVFAFCSMSFVSFYVFFEISLVPVLILIIERGVQPERLSAVFYMVLYTLMGSLPFLALISFHHSVGNGFSMVLPAQMGGLLGPWGLLVMMAFLVKLPCYPFHLWLAKAHVEAPTEGSMALAGLLLKLGGIGLMRCMLVFGSFSAGIGSFLMALGMWGGFICSVICLRLLDAKSLVAYASVGHMALVLAGILSGSVVGWKGAVAMMVSHGLSSSGMFSLLGGFYEMVGSRSLLVMKGMGGYVPGLMVWWFVLCVSCMSCPPSFNFLAEVSLGMGVSSVCVELLMVFCFMAFFVGIYSLVLFSTIFHGVSGILRPKMGGLIKMGNMGVFHCVPILLLFVFSGCVI
uniref:NADH-ubiquinone oxidoreductase chain 4 n=1 Tax=Spondylus violaceus TaxID=1163653 RepID=A0A515MNR7_9BIVA|nr:NADH dehydrogenase subunit 4 [Spondylus violaceus]